MNKREFKKQAYVSPSIEVGHTTCNEWLMSTSFSNNGGHNKVGDDGNDLNAKEGFFEEEEEEQNMPQQWSI